jgi:hypothetical protein
LYKPIFGGSREPLPPSPLHEPGSSADLGKIFLTLNPNKTCTPQGRNLYHYPYRQSTSQRFYYLYTISMSTEDHNLAANYVTAVTLDPFFLGDSTFPMKLSNVFSSYHYRLNHYLAKARQVDSLCILQNNATDKNHEIGAMPRTYSDAYVTIVASAANDAAGGFLQPRPATTDLITLPFRVSTILISRAGD